MSDIIKTLQAELAAGNFYGGKIDGVFGPLSLAALESRMRMEIGQAPKWMPIARAEYGVSEILGARHNPRILEYHASTSLGAETDEVSWCSSFVNWCVDLSGAAGTRSAAARSWLNWRGAATILPENARYGDVVVFKRGSQSWQGHVAFFVYQAQGLIWHLGGNQSNRVNVSSSPASALLGVRR